MQTREGQHPEHPSEAGQREVEPSDRQQDLGECRTGQLRDCCSQTEQREQRSELARVGRTLQQHSAEVVHERQARAHQRQDDHHDRSFGAQAERDAHDGRRHEGDDEGRTKTRSTHDVRRYQRAEQSTRANEGAEQSRSMFAQVERLQRQDHQQHIECADHQVSRRGDADHTDAPGMTAQLCERQSHHSSLWCGMIGSSRERERRRAPGGDGQRDRRTGGACDEDHLGTAYSRERCCDQRPDESARAIAARHPQVAGHQLAGGAHDGGHQHCTGGAQCVDRAQADHDECRHRWSRSAQCCSEGRTDVGDRLQRKPCQAHPMSAMPGGECSRHRSTDERWREDGERDDADR